MKEDTNQHDVVSKPATDAGKGAHLFAQCHVRTRIGTGIGFSTSTSLDVIRMQIDLHPVRTLGSCDHGNLKVILKPRMRDVKEPLEESACTNFFTKFSRKPDMHAAYRS